ncbi:hypothetical protein LCGC14_2235510 [marine sediment metagenome]|uniref:Uncharacterized protein n=1 Tax=marine sediment metagenome TaxID=412755 RepID=A0A0F9G205_9ZZZZ
MPPETEKPTELAGPVADPMPIVEHAEVAPLAPQQPTDIIGLIDRAIDKGAPIETIERLEAMHVRMIERIAVVEFNRAKAQFQADCPPLIRRHKNDAYTHVNRAGVREVSKYTNLEDMEATVRESLTKNGFSWDWGDMEEDVEKQQLSMPFILTHIGGHHKVNRATLPTTPGEGAEKKKTTEQQIRFSVVTYLQRLSMRLGLGLGGGEYDDDGANSGTETVKVISGAQYEKLHAFMLDVKANQKDFYAYFKIKDVKELPANRYEEAMRILDRKWKKIQANLESTKEERGEAP